MYASLFDLYAVLDALLFQTVGADARILPMGQKTTPSPDPVSYTHLDVYKRQFHHFP